MNTSDQINLESSLLGFCNLHKDVVFYNDHGIVMRNDENFANNKSRVMIISGGGAGHEPGMGIGFVGRGMLDSVVCGNIFTSPSVMSCLAAILLARDPNREILIIINNYTGDLLNFGLAVEMARNDHNYSNIKLLVVDDDASIDNPSHSTGRRGLAGSLIINKIAGAMSEQEYSLEEIYDYCENILSERAVQTIGFSFHHNNSNELVDIEIGYGIHGEPGSIKIEKEKNFKPIIGILKKKLRLSDVKSEVVILFNNLGGTSEFSFYHFVHEFIENVKELPIKIVKVYAGKFLTSLSKEALSVTILEVKNPKTFELLEFEVEIPCKHLFNMPLSLNVPTLKNFEIPKILRHQSPEAQAPSKEIEIARKMIEKACKAAVGMRKCLNEIDGELGDGDTGSTVERGAKALLKHDELEFNNPHNMLQQISEILMKAMGGTSGAIFSIFFQCASKAFAEDNRYSLDNWITGISMGFDGIMLLGKGNIGDRTLLDALYFGLMRMKENSRKSTKEALAAFGEGCYEGTEATKKMKPKAGRSCYSVSDAVFEFTSENPDPGALAVYIISREISKAFNDL